MEHRAAARPRVFTLPLLDREESMTARQHPAAELELSVKGNSVRFRVHATPRARRSAIGAVRGGVLDVRVAAPPVDGLANGELVRTIAEALGVAKTRVAILRGAAGRDKLVEVALLPDLTVIAVKDRLQER
jgi:uncharacterized protein YggU (UPF0235/DUF167 family)